MNRAERRRARFNPRRATMCPVCRIAVTVFVNEVGECTIPEHGHKRQCSGIGKNVIHPDFVKPEPKPEPPAQPRDRRSNWESLNRRHSRSANLMAILVAASS